MDEKIVRKLLECKTKDDIYEFYKEHSNDMVWKVEHYILYDKNKGSMDGNIDKVLGEVLFSFDKKRILNVWTDYPYKLSKEEKEIFDKENPYWAIFFSNRCKKNNIEEIREKIQEDLSLNELIDIYVFANNKFYDIVKEIGNDAYTNEWKYLYIDVGNLLMRKIKDKNMNIDNVLMKRGYQKNDNSWIKSNDNNINK